jgi:REP element-mobilizing transposase RayT
MPQSLSKLYIHLVISTMQREPLLLRPLRARVHAYLATVLKNLESPARRIAGMSNHVYIDEYRKFLQTYGIEYDERYVWD